MEETFEDWSIFTFTIINIYDSCYVLGIESNLIFNTRVGVISHFINEENGAQGIGVIHPG